MWVPTYYPERSRTSHPNILVCLEVGNDARARSLQAHTPIKADLVSSMVQG